MKVVYINITKYYIGINANFTMQSMYSVLQIGDFYEKNEETLE